MSRPASFIGAAGVLLIGGMALMQSLPPAPPSTNAPTTAASRPCTMQPDGYLRGRFFGALSLMADWSGAKLYCDGMRRPDGGGVRLFFSGVQPGGNPAGGDRLSVLIGIDGRLEDLVGAERPANVTVIDERQDRFYSTGGPGRCWATISSVTVLHWSRSANAGYRIAGLVYCVGALPAIADRSSITLGDLSFAGRVAGG